MSLWGEQVSFQGRRGGPGVITLAGFGVTEFVIQPATANAVLTLESDGDIWTHDGDTGNNWVTPGSAAAFYEVFATLDSGTLSSGTIGIWQVLSNNRTWSRNRVAVGTNTAQITLQIREIGTAEILATAVFPFTATVESTE